MGISCILDLPLQLFSNCFKIVEISIFGIVRYIVFNKMTRVWKLSFYYPLGFPCVLDPPLQLFLNCFKIVEISTFDIVRYIIFNKMSRFWKPFHFITPWDFLVFWIHSCNFFKFFFAFMLTIKSYELTILQKILNIS